jgi:hypothetical protein
VRTASKGLAAFRLPGFADFLLAKERGVGDSTGRQMLASEEPLVRGFVKNFADGRAEED